MYQNLCVQLEDVEAHVSSVQILNNQLTNVLNNVTEKVVDGAPGQNEIKTSGIVSSSK